MRAFLFFWGEVRTMTAENNTALELTLHWPEKDEAELQKLRDAAQNELYEIFAAYAQDE